MIASLKSLWLYVCHSFSWERCKHSSYWLAALLLAYVPLWWLLGSWTEAGLVALALILVAKWMQGQYMGDLKARIADRDSVAWDVEVNRVTVGTIADADYALIRHRVYSDVRVYLSQALNVLHVALNAFEYSYRAIPIGLFWIGVTVAVFSPGSISSVLAALPGATAESIRHAVPAAGAILVVVMVVSVGLNWIFGLSHFGLVNRFEEAVGVAIRKHCGVAADGSIVLSRWVDGCAEIGD